MKVIIAGAGMTGVQVARTLTADGQDIVVIDPLAEVVRDVSNRLDCMAVHGRANNLSDLLQAGVKDADYFIALTGSDEINIISCALVSAEFKGVRTIARVRSLEYGHGRLYHTLEAGIDHIINPETETAVNILTSIVYGALSDVVSFDGMDIQIRDLVLAPGTKLHKHRLIDIHRGLEKRFLVILVVRQDTYIIPSGETVIHEGDHIYIAAANNDFDSIFEALGKSQKSLKSILIAGGGRIAEAVAGYLTGRTKLYTGGGTEVPGLHQLWGKRRVRIVEEDYDRCKELSEALPEAVVIQGDISDESLFLEEGLVDCDVIVATTESEERNIVSGLYAKRRGIRRAICLVFSSNYLSIASQLDIDVAISRKNAVANSVLEIIREGRVAGVQSLADGSVEILEFEIDARSRISAKPLMTLSFPPETLVIAVQRGEESFIPRGATELTENDRILVLTRKQYAQRVEDLVNPPVE